MGTLSPEHQGLITQLCRVRQTETRILWSYSLSDKTIKIWLQETSDDLDMRQLVDELTSAQAALTDQLRSHHEDALRQQAYRDAVQEHVTVQLEESLESLAASALRASDLETLSEDLRRQLEVKTAESQQHAQRAAEAEEHTRSLAEQCDAQAIHSQKSSK